MVKETIKRLELARTGQHGIDGATLTKKDLQEAVDTFEGTAPVSIGHQMAKEDWFPSFGSVLTVELTEHEDGENATLIGDVKMNDLLSDAYDQGLYTGWSISLPARASDGKRYIHHLAFLGAVPPKIKDLKVIESLKEKEAIDMSEASSGSTFTFIFPNTPKEENVGAKKNEPGNAHEFSDAERSELEQLREKDRTSKKQRVMDAAAKVLPKAYHGALSEFCDAVSGVADCDFSDDQMKVKKAPLEVLADLFGKIPAAATVLETELNFADTQPRGEEEDVDCAQLAQDF